MTDPMTSALPAGPPWSLDVLADLHAGLYPPDLAAELHARIQHDPEAREMLAALDDAWADTVSDLREDRDRSNMIPAPRLPEHVAARLEATLAAEVNARFPPLPHPATFTPATFTLAAASAPPGGVIPLDRSRRRRQRWLAGIGAVAAAAAIGTVVTIAVNGNNSADVSGGAVAQNNGNDAPTDDPGHELGPTGTAQGARPGGGPTATEGVPDKLPSGISAILLPIAAGRLAASFDQIEGYNMTTVPVLADGGLDNPAVLEQCLQSNKVADQVLEGIRLASYQGQNGYAIALTETADGAQATVLMVGARCGLDGAQTLGSASFVR